MGIRAKRLAFSFSAPLKSGIACRGLKIRGWMGGGVLLLGSKSWAGTSHRFHAGAQNMRGGNMQIAGGNGGIWMR